MKHHCYPPGGFGRGQHLHLDPSLGKLGRQVAYPDGNCPEFPVALPGPPYRVPLDGDLLDLAIPEIVKKCTVTYRFVFIRVFVPAKGTC